jgi:hypothetical protein
MEAFARAPAHVHHHAPVRIYNGVGRVDGVVQRLANPRESGHSAGAQGRWHSGAEDHATTGLAHLVRERLRLLVHCIFAGPSAGSTQQRLRLNEMWVTVQV